MEFHDGVSHFMPGVYINHFPLHLLDTGNRSLDTYSLNLSMSSFKYGETMIELDHVKIGGKEKKGWRAGEVIANPWPGMGTNGDGWEVQNGVLKQTFKSLDSLLGQPQIHRPNKLASQKEYIRQATVTRTPWMQSDTSCVFGMTTYAEQRESIVFSHHSD